MRKLLATASLLCITLAGCSAPAAAPNAGQFSGPTVVATTATISAAKTPAAATTPANTSATNTTGTTGGATMTTNDVKQIFSQAPIEEKDLGQGLKLKYLKKGNGPQVQAGDNLTVHYEGRLSNGTVFDSSLTRGQPVTFQIGVGGLIPGWDKALVGLKVGDVVELDIPAPLGYGSRGSPPVIPANADLVFKIAILNTQK